MSCCSSTLVSAKMLRMSSSTISALRPASDGIVLVQLLEHLALLGRQAALDAVQEQRGLVEQPVRRLHVLDDDRFGQPPQLGLLLLRQLLAGVDDDRDLRQPRARPSSSRAGRSRSCRRARGRGPGSRTFCASSAASASAPVATAVRLHVAVADQLDDALALDVVVLDDQQVADLAVDEAGDRGEAPARAPRVRPAWPGAPSPRAACRGAPLRAAR